jgi:CBS domain-containing protein
MPKTHKTELPTSQQLLTDLSSITERARLQVHLLSMDARKRWNEVEPKLLELEGRLEREGDHATDFLVATARELVDSLAAFLESSGGAAELKESVRAVMSEPVVSVSVDDRLDQASQVMWEQDCGAVPVVSADHVVLGMITDRDICMAAYTRGSTLHAETVASVMSKELYSCKLSDSIAEALALMARYRVRRLPVLSEAGALAGVVSLADIARRVGASVEACRAIAHTLTAICQKPQPVRAAAE